MGKFKFDLQPVLEYREILEEQRKTEYGRELQNLKKIEEYIEILNTEMVEIINSSRNLINEDVDIDKIKVHNEYVTYLKNEIKRQQISLQKQRKIVELKRIDMLKAVTDKSSVELLKEKYYNEHKILVKKKEQKHIDEIVSFKYTTA